MPRKINQATRDLIESEEGRVLFAYDDAYFPPRPAEPGDKIKGTLTIGAGHTGPDVYAGQRIDNATLERLFDQDITAAETTVSNLVTVELTDNQYGALVSLVENIGGTAFKNSTLLKRVNARQFDKVPAEFARWDHTTIDGKLVESNGLKGRRAREAILWAAGPSAPPYLPTGTAVGVKPEGKPSDAAASGIFGAAFLGILSRFFTGTASPFDYLLAFIALGAALVFLLQFVRKGK